MRRAATPAEFERLIDSLEHLEADRRPPIARLVFEVVADCHRCDEPVRRCDPRVLIGLDPNDRRRLAHLMWWRCGLWAAGERGWLIASSVPGGLRRWRPAVSDVQSL